MPPFWSRFASNGRALSATAGPYPQRQGLIKNGQPALSAALRQSLVCNGRAFCTARQCRPSAHSRVILLDLRCTPELPTSTHSITGYWPVPHNSPTCHDLAGPLRDGARAPNHIEVPLRHPLTSAPIGRALFRARQHAHATDMSKPPVHGAETPAATAEIRRRGVCRRPHCRGFRDVLDLHVRPQPKPKHRARCSKTPSCVPRTFPGEPTTSAARRHYTTVQLGIIKPAGASPDACAAPLVCACARAQVCGGAGLRMCAHRASATDRSHSIRICVPSLVWSARKLYYIARAACCTSGQPTRSASSRKAMRTVFADQRVVHHSPFRIQKRRVDKPRLLQRTTFAGRRDSGCNQRGLRADLGSAARRLQQLDIVRYQALKIS
jgi:hypothetical protein